MIIDVGIYLKKEDKMEFRIREKDGEDEKGFYTILKFGDATIYSTPEQMKQIASHILSQLQEHDQKLIKEGELIDE